MFAIGLIWYLVYVTFAKGNLLYCYNLKKYIYFQFNPDVWIVVCGLRSDVWGYSRWCYFVICGPEFYIQPSNVGRVTVLLELYARWEVCIFIVFRSVEIKFCKAVSSVLFIYVVIQKRIHYLNLLCVILLLPTMLFQSNCVHWVWKFYICTLSMVLWC